jgi:hypothetical protein
MNRALSIRQYRLTFFYHGGPCFRNIIETDGNYSAPIHQDGEKPVLLALHFFSGASWLFAQLAKTKAQGPQTVRPF